MTSKAALNPVVIPGKHFRTLGPGGVCLFYLFFFIF